VRNEMRQISALCSQLDQLEGMQGGDHPFASRNTVLVLLRKQVSVRSSYETRFSGSRKGRSYFDVGEVNGAEVLR